MKKLTLQILTFFISCFMPLAAEAFPIAASGAGLPVIVSGTDDVIATYQGNSAAFSNDLFLDSPGGPIFIFNNHSSAVGSTVNLGSFTPGTELLFRLHVNNTGNDFFTGPASRNPDDEIHARVEDSWMPGETLVSFEDLLNGPFHFNDLSFSFTNTTTTAPVPEPATMVLFGTGMLGAFIRKRLKA